MLHNLHRPTEAFRHLMRRRRFRLAAEVVKSGRIRWNPNEEWMDMHDQRDQGYHNVVKAMMEHLGHSHFRNMHFCCNGCRAVMDEDMSSGSDTEME